MKRGSSLVAQNASTRHSRLRAPPVSWLFRTNLPLRRGLPLPDDVRKRNFFGVGEVIGVLANPGETLKSLTDAKKSLEEARKEIQEAKERAQLHTTHTFSPFPGFFPRRAELQAIERILKGAPSFTVLFGASSVGKTALLREVLSRDSYHVLHFDLRIAGFADLASLYMSLNRQMEQYFYELSRMDGYHEFEKEGWGFKHDRINVEKIIESAGPNAVKTSDIARLMELFQSSLLRYWKFEPKEDSIEETGAQNQNNSSHTVVARDPSSSTGSHNEKSIGAHRKPVKKVPVFFLDEAHKLPALIGSTDAMKCLLDSMLVLTKQDRLCHVIHATSDSFYQTWLRQLNIMQHCKIVTIGDCSKSEAQAYYQERILPGVPETLRPQLRFDVLYDAFGGKLAHWADFVTDFVNSNGELSIKTSSHFLQAYSLLNLHLLYSGEDDCEQGRSEPRSNSPTPSQRPAGFRVYSPLPAAPSLATVGSGTTDSASGPAFNANQLLAVMRKLSEPGVQFIPYFPLCRELGIQAVDEMVRGRILELRWMDTVTPEGEETELKRMKSLEERIEDSAMGSSSDLRHDVERKPGRRDGALVGPKVYPTTPIMRYAMGVVTEEHDRMYLGGESRRASAVSWKRKEGDGGSEYASLSEVDEY